MTTTEEKSQGLEEAKAHFDKLLADWLQHDDTPVWAHELIAAAAEIEATSYGLLHLHTDISLCEQILENNNRADLEAWSRAEYLPDWIREALVAFSFTETKWAQNRVLADLDTIKALVEERMGFTVP